MTKSASQLWAEVGAARVEEGTLALWWLYQSGVLVKTPGGTTVVVDPYLSESVMRSYQLPRNVPAPLDPVEAEVDALLATHSHEDHLDPDSVPGFMSHPGTVFVGPPMAVERAVSSGAPRARTRPIARAEEVEVGDLVVKAVHARHMFGLEPTPDAVGYVLTSGGVSIYHSGDTEYDSEIVADTRGVSCSLISINGTTGNMNAHEAAMLAWLQEAKMVSPFHYGLWRDQDYGAGVTLDPQLFVATYNRLGARGTPVVLEPSTRVVVGRHGPVP